MVGGTAAGGVLNSVNTRLQRGTNALDPVQILQAASYADSYRLDGITSLQYYQYMKELGYSENQAKVFFHNTRVWLSKEDAGIKRIAQSFNVVFEQGDVAKTSGELDSLLATIVGNYQKEMYRLGYDSQESLKIFEALRPVPTFSILLEWLAKEVFEPDVRSTFKLDEDYPRIWANLMTAIKVPEFEAKAYWAAHWNHPSPGQIGQMYTRFRSDRTNKSTADAKGAGTTIAKLNMTKDDFTEALKLHEIAPYWRDRIIANSFTPLNITTLQGAYVYGLESDDWFLGRLEDYGYSAENAQFILKVWRRKYPYASKAPRADNILLRVQTGETHRLEGVTEMVDAGIPKDAAEFVVDIAYEKWILRREREKIKAWRDLKKRGIKTDNEIFDLIKASGYNDGRANSIWELVLDADPGYANRMRYRDISRGYQDGKLTKTEARSAYEDLRVYDDDINTLLKVYEPDPDAQPPDPID